MQKHENGEGRGEHDGKHHLINPSGDDQKKLLCTSKLLHSLAGFWKAVAIRAPWRPPLLERRVASPGLCKDGATSHPPRAGPWISSYYYRVVQKYYPPANKHIKRTAPGFHHKQSPPSETKEPLTAARLGNLARPTQPRLKPFPRKPLPASYWHCHALGGPHPTAKVTTPRIKQRPNSDTTTSRLRRQFILLYHPTIDEKSHLVLTVTTTAPPTLSGIQLMAL